jgi:lipopolysaccharide heptosyltransferase II
MGDLLMSSPAIRALKETFNCKITVLTSSMAGKIAENIPWIDDAIICDVPWVKNEKSEGPAGYFQLLETIRKQNFDAAVIFTVFSQNPLPAVMLAYLAGIPRRLAYCRENPYELLTDWVPEKEPYSIVKHQVARDLHLVAAVGATTSTDNLSLVVPDESYARMYHKLTQAGLNVHEPWIIVHPGASERKREYPPERFNLLMKKIIDKLDVNILLTGGPNDRALTETLRAGIEHRTYSVAGLLSLEEFMAAIHTAHSVLSVNTGTVHIASALRTPVVVLYASTNPQHTPWKCESKVFMFPVEEKLQSKNEVLRYVTRNVMSHYDFPDHDEIVHSLRTLMRTAHPPFA